MFSSFFRHLPYALYLAVIVYKINHPRTEVPPEQFPKVYVRLDNVHDINGKQICKNATYEGEEPKQNSKLFVLTSEGVSSVISENSKYSQIDTAWYQGGIFFHVTEATVL